MLVLPVPEYRTRLFFLNRIFCSSSKLQTHIIRHVSNKSALIRVLLLFTHVRMLLIDSRCYTNCYHSTTV